MPWIKESRSRLIHIHGYKAIHKNTSWVFVQIILWPKRRYVYSSFGFTVYDDLLHCAPRPVEFQHQFNVLNCKITKTKIWTFISCFIFFIVRKEKILMERKTRIVTFVASIKTIYAQLRKASLTVIIRDSKDAFNIVKEHMNHVRLIFDSHNY